MNKIKLFTQKKNNLIILIITIILFITISILTFTNNLNYIDTITHDFILSIRNNFLSTILYVITNTGTSYFLITLSILLLIIIKNKKIPFLISTNLILSFATNEIAKIIFSRERPIGINLIEETSYSYPSGHSMVSLAYYGLIIYLTRKYFKNKKLKNIITTILSINILIVGFSRIYLGVHYLTDVIAGFLLALIYLNIFLNIINKEKK